MPRVTITVPGEFPQPYRFALDSTSVIIGRLPESDIAVDSASVSSRHAQMIRIKGGYELHDLGSTNGIELDGRRVVTVALRDGMTLELGDVAFEFLLAPEERAMLDMEASVGLKPEPTEKNLPPVPQQTLNPPSIPAAPRVPTARPAPAPAHASSNNSGSGLLLLVLALLAFCAGMAFRFYNDTGRSWIDAVRSKYAAREASSLPGK